MAFSKAFIEEVAYRSDIEEIIGRAVQLKRAGVNLSGLCPFHSEKTPSFTVFPATKSFYCFGCGAGGDVFTFVMNHENLDYPGAIEYLARHAGIPIENTEPQKKGGISRDRIFAINKEAARYYFSMLQSEKGTEARNYLKEKRRLSDVTVRRFGIGYAPDGWDNLYKYLLSKNFTLEEMTAAFLAKKNDKGNIYDIFRNRIMFPLIDVGGEVLGFSARRLNESDERKYVNTSDTPVFKKSKFVFALNLAKKNKESEMILCEGCVDAVALHQAGFEGAVATLGTAFTADHARIVSRFTKKVYLAYDGDTAGSSATAKCLDMLSKMGINAKIINLGDIKDPDEYIKQYGKSGFERLLHMADGEVDYMLKKISGEFNLSVPEEKLNALKKLAEYIATFSSKASREVYSSRAAAILSISYDALFSEVERAYRLRVSRDKKNYERKKIQSTLGFEEVANRDKLKLPAAAIIEERILGMLILLPELYKDVRDRLTTDSFMTEFGKKAFSAIYPELSEEKPIVIGKHDLLTSQEIALLSKLAANATASPERSTDALKELVKKLEEQKSKADADAALSAGSADESIKALEEYLKKKGK